MAIAREARLLVRHMDGFRAAAPLLLHPPEAGLPAEVAGRMPGSLLTTFTGSYAVHRDAAPGPGPTVFGAWYDPPADRHDGAMLFLPRGRDAAAMGLALTAAALRPGAPVWIVGEIRTGIKSVRALIEERIGPVERSESGFHAVLHQAALTVAPRPAQGLDAWARTFEVAAGPRPLTVVTLPGVFSHGELDAGTALLLTRLDPGPNAAVLDFGCGAGVLGAWLRLTRPDCRVELADVSAVALEATRRTLDANRLPADGVVAADVFEGLDGTWDLIVSNPPFHDGYATDTRVAEAFIAQARDRLNPGGKLQIVANRFLRYLPLLEEHFKRVKVTAQTTVYRVYEATRGPKA